MEDTPNQTDDVVIVDADAVVADPPVRETAPSEVAADNAEVQAKADAENAKGYVGQVSDPLPNSAHSLASGPDSPALAPDDRTRFDQPAAVTKEVAE